MQRRALRHGLPPAPMGSLERGVALVIALILLIVITLMGFAAVRGTIMQQRMASNVYDRQVAFQSAEAALRIAADRISSGADIARNCQAGGVICLGNPFDDPNLPTGSILDVPAGSSSSQYTAATIASGQPQYVVENMGDWYDASSSTGANQSAGAHNYNPGSNSGQTAIYYRITARSGDPDKVGSRAVVTLQAMIKSG